MMRKKDHIVEIALKSYEDIFDSWDSSRHNSRVLAPDFKTFIEDYSKNISLGQNITLKFNVRQNRNESLELIIQNGLNNYLTNSIRKIKEELSFRRRKVVYYFSISIIFVTISLYIQNIKDTSIVENILLHSLSIASWVFLWEAFSILFIQNSELLKKRKHYIRLLNAEIVFNYNKI